MTAGVKYKMDCVVVVVLSRMSSVEATIIVAGGGLEESINWRGAILIERGAGIVLETDNLRAKLDTY